MSNTSLSSDTPVAIPIEQPVIENRPTRKVIPFLVAGVTAFGVSLRISNNWVFAAIYAAICSGILAVIAVWLLESMAARYLRSNFIQIVLPVCIGVAGSYFSFLSVDQAFERVFDVPRPSGVRDAETRRAYTGGPGEEETVLWFHATPAVVDRLLKVKSFQKMSIDASDSPQDRSAVISALAAWSPAFGDEIRRVWLAQKGEGLPDVYLCDESSECRTTRLIYDADAGFVIVVRNLD